MDISRGSESRLVDCQMEINCSKQPNQQKHSQLQSSIKKFTIHNRRTCLSYISSVLLCSPGLLKGHCGLFTNHTVNKVIYYIGHKLLLPLPLLLLQLRFVQQVAAFASWGLNEHKLPDKMACFVASHVSVSSACLLMFIFVGKATSCVQD